MGVNQNRQSKSRVSKRRAMQKISAPNIVECPHCHKYTMQHHMCPNCGYYNGKEVVSMGE
ncbi:MAG: 50S ribosomal protein L32 [Eubacteriales bacterium]